MSKNIEFKYSNADPDERTFIGSNISAEETHFKVSSTADGLKIETKEVTGESRVKDSGSKLSFYVNGKRLPIAIGIDNEHKGAETFISMCCYTFKNFIYRSPRSKRNV